MTPAHRILAVLFLLALLVLVPRWLDTHGQDERLVRLSQEVERVTGENAVLRDRNERLIDEVEGLRDDPTLLERRVRDELEWIGPNELLILFTSPTVRTDWTARLAHGGGE